jgi:hypothetical protein
MNCRSLVSELTYYEPDDFGLNSRKGTEFSLLRRIQTGSGVHTACYSVEIGCSFGNNVNVTIHVHMLPKLKRVIHLLL